MRDPRRIDDLLDLLRQFWHSQPDLRFGQILAAVTCHGDPFYVEDAVVADWLADRLLKENKSNGTDT